MPWFAVRCVYLFGIKKDGTNIFEERIVAFEADVSDHAFATAERESERYMGDSITQAHPEMHAYFQDDDPLIDGYEVWSMLYQSRCTLDEFYQRQYVDVEYQPDE